MENLFKPIRRKCENKILVGDIISIMAPDTEVNIQDIAIDQCDWIKLKEEANTGGTVFSGNISELLSREDNIRDMKIVSIKPRDDNHLHIIAKYRKITFSCDRCKSKFISANGRLLTYVCPGCGSEMKYDGEID